MILVFRVSVYLSLCVFVCVCLYACVRVRVYAYMCGVRERVIACLYVCLCTGVCPLICYEHSSHPNGRS